MSSPFPKKEIFANLGLEEEDVIFYELTDSTNTRAREAFLNPKYSGKTMLFMANGQTAGRGTRGRSFESKADTGLYLSLLFTPSDENFDASLLTPIAAAAVLGSLSAQLGEYENGFFIKWVNDVFFGRKKISGILCERVIGENGSGYIVGIGVNLYGADFSPAVRDIAASVEEVTGIRVDKKKLIYDITRELIYAVRCENTDRLLDFYRRRMIPCGTPITVTDGMGKTRAAKVLGTDESLHLIVQYENAEFDTLISGDVSVKFD